MTNGSRDASAETETIGLDLSDQSGLYVVIDGKGDVVKEGKVALTMAGIERVFGRRKPCRIALEVGTHSPWVSRALDGMGYEVIVANARQVGLIARSSKKTDRVDAETLARAARYDPALLKPIRHRGVQAQADLAELRARRALLESRTRLINSARGLVKATGSRLPKCSADCFAAKAREHVPEVLATALEPMLIAIGGLTQQIQAMTRHLTQLAKERYPETAMLTQVHGVGLICSLTYVLTLEDPGRFQRSRGVGAYLGLVARQRDSGEQRPQLRITKSGDVYLRSVLVQSAQHILGPFGPDCDLRRWGLKLAGTGSKMRKNKAIIAVARKLSVLLHRLWSTGEVYEPLRQAGQLEAAA
jgi:transposase